MPSGPSSPSKRLNKLASEIPPDVAIHAHLGGLVASDQDYPLAMMGASFVEKALEVAILSRLTPMSNEERARLFDFSHRGPLSDLSSRIILARSMGLFGPRTFDDLQRIREIRNAFAHSLWYITFATKEVADMCDFHSARRIMSARSTIAGGNVPGSTQRTRYAHSARFIAGALKTRIQADVRPPNPAS